MQVQAAIFREPHKPLSIETVDLDAAAVARGRSCAPSRPASATATSTSSTATCGGMPLDGASMVLGHEGAGIVEAVGDDVTYVRAGDHVVACLSGFCGNCEQCLSGHPNLCTGRLSTTRDGSGAPRLSLNGQPRADSSFGIASFAESMLLHENSLVKIDDDLPLDKAALVGCGVLTGVGAALRTAGLQAGQTVAVFGCGGVGLSIIQGARIGGAAPHHRRRHVRRKAGDGEAGRRHRLRQQRSKRTRSRRCGH